MHNQHILEILQSREIKHQQIQTFVNKYHQAIVLSINYAGDIKCNKDSEYVFNYGHQILLDTLNITYYEKYESACGYYGIYSSESNVDELKQQAIKLEDTLPLGRLLDIDVYNCDGIALNRKNYTSMTRKCFICNQDAKTCGRNRTHSVEELENYFHLLVQQYQNIH